MVYASIRETRGDLNNDGDLLDAVLRAFDVSLRTWIDLGYPTLGSSAVLAARSSSSHPILESHGRTGILGEPSCGIAKERIPWPPRGQPPGVSERRDPSSDLANDRRIRCST